MNLTVKHLITGAGFLMALTLTPGAKAQRLANRYAIEFLRGPGTYLLADGTAGQGDLQFRTRDKTILYVNRKQEFPGLQVKSFTIDGHTLVPRGTFDFAFGLHEYHAENTFIEYADTTGTLQLAAYYTAEPTGDMTTYFTTFLLRRRGDHAFIVGPNNNRKWRKPERQLVASSCAQWPQLQQGILSGEVTFENFADYVRRANQLAP